MPLLNLLSPEVFQKIADLYNNNNGLTLYSVALTVMSIVSLGWLAKQNANLRADLKEAQRISEAKDARFAEKVAASDKNAEHLNKQFFELVKSAMKITPQVAQLGESPNPQDVVNIIADQTQPEQGGEGSD